MVNHTVRVPRFLWKYASKEGPAMGVSASAYCVLLMKKGVGSEEKIKKLVQEADSQNSSGPGPGENPEEYF